MDYRDAAGIAHDLGTAVNIVAMVFGNLGDQSLPGVAISRNGTTGENRMEVDYLINAQGEDVVAGILKKYRLDPHKNTKADLGKSFDAIFGHKTGYATLDNALKRIHQNKSDFCWFWTDRISPFIQFK